MILTGGDEVRLTGFGMSILFGNFFVKQRLRSEDGVALGSVCYCVASNEAFVGDWVPGRICIMVLKTCS